MSDLPAFLPLKPLYYPRVWGGEKLAPPTGDTPIGEAWIADGESEIVGGPFQGQTVNALMQRDARALLGKSSDSSFPLLIKLLDCREWLSVQVHPNDKQAHEMVGPGERGKTEAWYILQAEPGSELIAGVNPGTTSEQLREAIQEGQILDISGRHQVNAGDSVYIPAGTLHALGPGLLLYEVQQASDTTYRVYDWGRPASAGRRLHLAESVRVTDPELSGDVRRAPENQVGQDELIRSPYFVLQSVGDGVELDTAGQVCHIVTGIEGDLMLVSGPEKLSLPQYATALVPAVTRHYTLRGQGRALIAQPVDVS